MEIVAIEKRTFEQMMQSFEGFVNVENKRYNAFIQQRGKILYRQRDLDKIIEKQLCCCRLNKSSFF